MLGLTIPDAIAFGSLCAALLAAYAGLVRGDRVRRESEDPEPYRGQGSLDALRALTRAILELATAIRAATPIDDDQYSQVLQTFMRHLDDRAQQKKR